MTAIRLLREFTMSALRYPPVAPGVSNLTGPAPTQEGTAPAAASAARQAAPAGRWPWSLADLLPALGRELAAQGARFAAIQLDGKAGCLVSALRTRPPAPGPWTLRLDANALSELVRRGRAERAAGVANAPTDGAAAASQPLLPALRQAGKRLEAQRPSSVLILASLEDGAVSVVGADGQPMPTERPRGERQVFHPGQQALYRSPRQDQPIAVTVRRLGRHQIQVTFPDGRDAAIHRKWLTPLDWSALGEGAGAPLTAGV